MSEPVQGSAPDETGTPRAPLATTAVPAVASGATAPSAAGAPTAEAANAVPVAAPQPGAAAIPGVGRPYAAAAAAAAPPAAPAVGRPHVTAAVSARPAEGPRHAHAPSLPRIGGIVVASALVPGTGHLVTGRRRTGTLLLLVTLVAFAALLTAAVIAWRDPATAATWTVRPRWLEAAQWGAPVLALGWAAVIVRSAFLSRPGTRGALGRSVAGVLTVLLVAAVAAPATVVSRYAGVQRDLLDDVFDPDPVVRPGQAAGTTASPSDLPARLNVLLVGSDAGPDRTGTRTDTVILASLDTRTGRTVLFSLPRNLERVPFAAGSVMAAQFPRGFSCGDECLLNAIYRWATDRPNLFPGEPDPGMTALRSAVSATLGVQVDYDALVDLTGFPALIDAVGGVTIRVDRDLPIGGLDAVGNHVRPSGIIKAGLQKMDGETALQYARSRSDSSDYERVQRQRCLLGAVQREVDPRTLLTNFQKLATSTAAAVKTDIPRSLLPDLVKLAFVVKEQPIESLTFTPPLINVGNPDFPAIRAAVQAALVAPAASPGPAPSSPTASAPVPAGPTPSSSPTAGSTTTSAPVSVDQVCSYS